MVIALLLPYRWSLALLGQQGVRRELQLSLLQFPKLEGKHVTWNTVVSAVFSRPCLDVQTVRCRRPSPNSSFTKLDDCAAGMAAWLSGSIVSVSPPTCMLKPVLEAEYDRHVWLDTGRSQRLPSAISSSGP